jgi:hypothetical protein
MPRDLDRLLDAWFDQGPTVAADRVVAAALAEVNRTPQVGLPRFRGVTIRLGSGSTSRRVVAIAIATLLVLALSVGIGVAAGLFRNIQPQPTTPEKSVDQQAIHVNPLSFGTITWERAESENRVVPWAELGGEIVGFDVDTDEWFVSPDGLSWAPMPSLPAANRVEFVDSADPLAFVSHDNYSVTMPFGSARIGLYDWHDEPGDAAVYARQGQSWIPLDLPFDPAPDAEGLKASSIRFEAPTAGTGSNWIVAAVRFVRVPWSEVVGARGKTDLWPVWNKYKRQLEVFPPGQLEDPVLTLEINVVTDPAAIEFRDASTGELVHTVSATLDGWSAEALARSLRGSGLHDLRFIARTAGEIHELLPPWPGGEEWVGDIVASGGKYFTASLPINDDYLATAVHLWESDDGVVWHAVPTNLPTEPFEYAYLAASDDRLVVNIQGAGDANDIWSSATGRDWDRAQIDPSQVGIPISTDFGFLLQPSYTTMLVSDDGVNWESAELPFLPHEPVLRYVHGLLFFGPESENERTLTWIGRLNRAG